MRIIVSFILAFIGVTAVYPGSFEGTYSQNEIAQVMTNLTATYPKWASTSPTLSGVRIKDATKQSQVTQKVLILGGFYGGYPVCAYEVLFVAQRLLEKANTSDSVALDIVTSLTIDFVPIINTKAFNLSEYQYNTTSKFTPVLTDLKGDPTKCNNSADIGVNLDRNFPEGWVFSNDTCSNLYSGNSAWSSTLISSFASLDYDLIINFQESGNYYFSPYTRKNDSLAAKYAYFFQRIFNWAPKPYTHNSKYNITNVSQGGSFLDYANSKNKIALQIAPGPSKDGLQIDAEDNFVFIETLLSDYTGIYPTFDSYSEEECSESNCTYYSTVTLKVLLENNSTTNLPFNIIIDFIFIDKATYKLISTKYTTQLLYSSVNNTSTLTSIDTNPLKYGLQLDGLSSASLVITYERSNSTEDAVFNSTVNINNNGIYITERSISKVFGVEDTDDDGSDDSKKNLTIGLAVGLILGFAFIIVGVVIYCYCCKKKESSNKDQI